MTFLVGSGDGKMDKKSTLGTSSKTQKIISPTQVLPIFFDMPKNSQVLARLVENKQEQEDTVVLPFLFCPSFTILALKYACS